MSFRHIQARIRNVNVVYCNLLLCLKRFYIFKTDLRVINETKQDFCLHHISSPKPVELPVCAFYIFVRITKKVDLIAIRVVPFLIGVTRLLTQLCYGQFLFFRRLPVFAATSRATSTFVAIPLLVTCRYVRLMSNDKKYQTTALKKLYAPVSKHKQSFILVVQSLSKGLKDNYPIFIALKK